MQTAQGKVQRHDAPRTGKAWRPTIEAGGTLATLLVSAALMALPSPVQATQSPDVNVRWYYNIGGADAVMGPLNASVQSVSISGSLNLSPGFNCHKFDPTLGLTTAIGQVVNNLEAVGTNALTSAVSALPGLILQRANPSLYELYQEVVSYANVAVSLATKSCEQMQSDINQGRNPFDKWLTLSKSYTWKDQMGKTQTGQQSVDVLSALGVVEGTGGDNGVPWAGGAKAGGKNQPPVKLVSDVVQAGYNIEQNQAGSVLGSNPGDAATLVGNTWKSPQDAVNFAVGVLGDMQVSTQGGAVPVATPGHGLLPQIDKDRATMTTALTGLVSGNTQPTPDNLVTASTPHTILTREVLAAIRKMSPQDQAIAVNKLASEASVATNVERALMLRRLLLAGWGEPHIYAAGVGDDIHRLVAIIDREVDQLLYESRIRKELVSSSAAAILDLSSQTDSNRAGTPAYRPGDAKPVMDGGAKPLCHRPRPLKPSQSPWNAWWRFRSATGSRLKSSRAS